VSIKKLFSINDINIEIHLFEIYNGAKSIILEK